MPGGRDPTSEQIPTTLEGLEEDIDYWTGRLGEGQPGSDWEYWVQTRLTKLDRARQRVALNSQRFGIDATPSSSSLQIFVSHSSRDEETAKRLITLIRSALNLPASAIRCTSVDGYRLPAGIPVDERLRQEIHDSTVFIALLTRNSMSSVYFLFELGARWATHRPLLPLLAGGTAQDLLRGPLSALNALSCENEAQLYQFIGDLATALQRPSESPAVYHKCVMEVVDAAKTETPGTIEPARRSGEAPEIRLASRLSQDGRELLFEAAQDRNGMIMSLPTLGGRIIQTNDRAFVEGGNPRSEARWKSAIDELRRMGLIEDQGHKGEAFAVTGDGYYIGSWMTSSRSEYTGGVPFQSRRDRILLVSSNAVSGTPSGRSPGLPNAGRLSRVHRPARRSEKPSTHDDAYSRPRRLPFIPEVRRSFSSTTRTECDSRLPRRATSGRTRCSRSSLESRALAPAPEPQSRPSGERFALNKATTREALPAARISSSLSSG